ncbi:MAG: DUF3102 domain-containing protein [Candidatus Aenigmarchaeota archaeon]|nr:DUF3102 domain-containing protein [Candidatus Aenigmarchaeota archaeon]
MRKAPEISREIQTCMMTSNEGNVDRAVRIGEQLLELKEDVGHGNWQTFVKETFDISLRTCQNYMKLAKLEPHFGHYDFGTEGVLKLDRAGFAVDTPWTIQVAMREYS